MIASHCVVCLAYLNIKSIFSEADLGARGFSLETVSSRMTALTFPVKHKTGFLWFVYGNTFRHIPRQHNHPLYFHSGWKCLSLEVMNTAFSQALDQNSLFSWVSEKCNLFALQYFLNLNFLNSDISICSKVWSRLNEKMHCICNSRTDVQKGPWRSSNWQ